MSAASDNPYVGPRAFTIGEPLYGRTRERAALLDLLVAERVVLLHAPSGAGKSSLLYAGLVPDLRAEGFRVRPPIRLGTEPPTTAPADVNRFVLSALLSLEEGVPAAQQRPLAELLGLDLAGYLGAEPDEAEVLIFDQFEEVLTIDSIGHAAKHAFFAALGAALRPSQRWAVIAIREDHLAGLAPYQRALPTRLRTTFHLDLLSAAAAMEAVQLPARARGVEFTDAAARKLIDDLRQVQLPGPDGALVRVPGPHVEPVQLQVACRNLWQRKPATDATIDELDVQEIGDVDHALTCYYDDQVAAVATAAALPESQIRAWFDRALISEQGLRGQVLQGAQDSQGLANSVVRRLVDTHLVRAEQRRGMIWFELAHDRLIAPVRASNSRWAAEHLGPAERQAQLWDSRGRPESLLLGELAEIDRLLARPQIGALERVFLEHSKVHRQRERDNRRLRRIVVILAGCVLAGLVATLGTLVALYELRSVAEEEARQTAERQALAAEQLARLAETTAREALSRQLAASVLLTPPERADVAALSALAASELSGGWEARVGLRNLQSRAPQLRGVVPGTMRLRQLAHDRGREQLAGLDASGRLYIWDLRTRETLSTRLQKFGADAVAFDPTRGQFATAERDGSVVFHGPEVEEVMLQPMGSLRALAPSRDGRRLVTVDSDGEVVVRDRTGAALARRRVLAADDLATAVHVALDPTGDTVAVGGARDSLWLWRWASEDPRRLRGATDVGAREQAPPPVAAVGFAADGLLHSLHGGGELWRWSAAGEATLLAELGKRAQLYTDDAVPLALGLADDAAQAAAIVCHSTCTREALVVWDAARGQADAVTVHLGERDPEKQPLALTVADDRVMVAGVRVGARVWTTRDWRPVPGPRDVGAIAVSGDGLLVAVGGCSGPGCREYSVAVWRADDRTVVHAALAGLTEPPRGLVFFAGDRRLAGFGRDGQAVLWDMSSGQATQARLPGLGDVLGLQPGGEGLVIGFGFTEGISLWDVLADESLRVAFKQSMLPPRALAIDPGGRWLAGGGCKPVGDGNDAARAREDVRNGGPAPCNRGAVHLWRLSGGEPVARLELHPTAVVHLAFSLAGDRLVSVGEDGSVFVSDVHDGLLQRPRGLGYDAFAQAAVFSRDGLALATVGCVAGPCAPAEVELRLWDASTLEPLGAGTRVHSPLAREGVVLPPRVAFAGADAAVITGSSDGAVVTDISLAGMRARACALAGRNFSAAEWARKLGPALPFAPLCPDLASRESAVAVDPWRRVEDYFIGKR